MDERKAFSFYRSYYEASKELPSKEEQADFLMAICSYIFDDTEPELHGVASAMFKLAKPNLETSIKRASAGQLGGKQNVSKREANLKQTESKTQANEKQTQNNKEANRKRYMINDCMIDDFMMNEKENKKEKKHQYGQYKNVLLSDKEMEKLKTEFPTDWQERIESVSSYCRMHGKTYKDYLATIRTWARKDRPKIVPVQKNDVQSGLAQALEILGVQDG